MRFRIIRYRMNIHGHQPIIPALERATHAAALWMERVFADLRLTQAEAHILAYLAGDAPHTINDLHHSFGHKRSTLTSLLDRLENRGWIVRGTDPASRRQVLVELTDAGRQVGERVSGVLNALEERVLARAGAGDAGAFLQVLHIVEEELSHDR